MLYREKWSNLVHWTVWLAKPAMFFSKLKTHDDIIAWLSNIQFGKKFWLKHEKNGCRFGRLVGPPGGPNLTGNRFFQVFITPNYPKCEKNQLPVLPTIQQARPSTRLNFYQWPFFLRFGLFGVDLEKKIQPKKPLNCYLTIDDVIMHG